MKNNQQKKRGRQPRRNQQPQQRNLTAALARIDITDNTVSVPRDEYDELLYSSALMDILHRLFDAGYDYAMGDLLRKIFKEANGEKEDK